MIFQFNFDQKWRHHTMICQKHFGRWAIYFIPDSEISDDTTFQNDELYRICDVAVLVEKDEMSWMIIKSKGSLPNFVKHEYFDSMDWYINEGLGVYNDDETDRLP